MEISQEGAPGPSRILVLDDEPAVRRAAASILQRAGFEVEGAGDVEAAEEALAQGGFALVLLDLNLRRGPSGFVLLRLLGSRGDPAIPVVLSATNEPEDLLACFRLGARDVVSKPLRGGELLCVVRRCLGLDPPAELYAGDPVEAASVAEATPAGIPSDPLPEGSEDDSFSWKLD